jgi:uncharacterized phage-associated protein
MLESGLLMARDVREVANAILDAAARDGVTLSNLALNKIAYFSHAWYLAIYSKPLIDSHFEAWQYGPVHPQLYHQLKRFGDQPVTSRLTRIDLDTGKDVPVEVRLSAEEVEHIAKITRFYSVRSASWLVEATHEPGAPWDQVWSAAERTPCPGMIIPDEITQKFYGLKRRNQV